MKKHPKKHKEPRFVVYEEVVEEYHGFSFGKKLLVYALCLALLLAGGILLLRRGLLAYEYAQPEHVVSSYILHNGRRAFYHALMNVYPDAENTYEPVYDIALDLANRYKKDLSYVRLVRESTYENPVYLVQSGGQNLLKLTLEQTGETVFLGAPVYRVSHCALVMHEQLTFTDYGIVFPAEATVFINERPLTVSAADTEAFPVFGGDGSFVACLPASFVSRPEVHVYLGKTELSPKEGEHFVFDPEGKLYTMQITAPKAATVRIDGTHVPSIFVTGEFESAPDALGRTVPMLAYTVPTVQGAGEVTAVQDGALLKTEAARAADGTVLVSVLPRAASATIRIPPTAVLYANGEAVTPAGNVTGMKESLLTELAGMQGAPKAHTYTFPVLYTVPVFTAADGGVDLTPVTDSDGIAFLPAPDGALQQAYTEAALDFMRAYLRYTTQGYSNTRENLDALQTLVDASSPLATALERSLIGYQFASPQKMTVRTLTADAFRPLTDTLFSCEIAYELELANFVGKTGDANTLRVTFRVTDGSPYAVAVTQIGK